MPTPWGPVMPRNPTNGARDDQPAVPLPPVGQPAVLPPVGQPAVALGQPAVPVGQPAVALGQPAVALGQPAVGQPAVGQPAVAVVVLGMVSLVVSPVSSSSPHEGRSARPAERAMASRTVFRFFFMMMLGQ